MVALFVLYSVTCVFCVGMLLLFSYACAYVLYTIACLCMEVAFLLAYDFFVVYVGCLLCCMQVTVFFTYIYRM